MGNTEGDNAYLLNRTAIKWDNLPKVFSSAAGTKLLLFFFNLLFCIAAVVQLLSHIQLWDPMDCSMPIFPVFHHLLECSKTHVRWVSDAIQPSHPLSSLSAPALNLSHHYGLFLYWGMADSQCCDSFRQTAKDLSHTYTCIHSPPNSPPI